MGIKRTSHKRTDLYEASLEGSVDLTDRPGEDCLEFLIDLFNHIRPRTRRLSAETRMQGVIEAVHTHPQLRINLQKAVITLLSDTNLVPALTESGMLLSRGFVQEFGARLNHKLLPGLQKEDEFLYVINRIFFKKKDYLWVEEINRDTWQVFFEQMDLSSGHQLAVLPSQLREALFILSYKVANFSLDPEVMRFLPEEIRLRNPFVRQNHIINQLKTKEEYHIPDSFSFPGIAHLSREIDNCLAAVQEIQELQATRGASLSLSYMTLSMRFYLERMRMMADFLENETSFTAGTLVDFFRITIRYEKRKNSLRELFSQTFGYIAYQIAEHKGTKGNKYITTTRREYWQMIVNSMWGGLIVCLMVLCKTLLGMVHMLPVWLGISYSVNYSLGFVAIEETGATLATKQPAFTASAVAGSLDTRKNEQPNLYNLAITVARITRSQLASFFGNLIIVFPVTYCIAWVYDLCFGHKLAEGAQAMKLLNDQHPWKSLSLLYAANTGVFLFISGLIAGFIQNKIQYSRVAERMQMHPVMRLTLPDDRLKRFAHYIEHHAGSLAGNIMLGFFLGMSSVVVKLSGIPFDIRHITISAGNVAIGAYGLGLGNIPWPFLTQVLAGVLAIGFVNFLVSFLLAFIVAVKSRGIRLRDYPEFIRILWRYFKKYPFDFIRPRKNSGTHIAIPN